MQSAHIHLRMLLNLKNALILAVKGGLMHNEKEKTDEPKIEAQHDEKTNRVFQIEEVTIEEMAIDGICGVY